MVRWCERIPSHIEKLARAETLAEAWQKCEDGHELIRLCGAMVGTEGWPTKQEILLAVCDCAETVLPYLPKEETSPRECVRVSRLWAEGKATVEEINEAGRIAVCALGISDGRFPSPPEGQSAIGRLPAGVHWAASAAYSIAYAASYAADADAHAADGRADEASGSSFAFMCITNAVPSFAATVFADAAGAQYSEVWRNARSESLKSMADLVRARLDPTAWGLFHHITVFLISEQEKASFSEAGVKFTDLTCGPRGEIANFDIGEDDPRWGRVVALIASLEGREGIPKEDRTKDLARPSNC